MRQLREDKCGNKYWVDSYGREWNFDEERELSETVRHDFFVNGEHVASAPNWFEFEEVHESLRPTGDRQNGWKELYSSSGGGEGYEIWVNLRLQQTKIIMHKEYTFLKDKNGRPIYTCDYVKDNRGNEGEIDTIYDDNMNLYFKYGTSKYKLDKSETGSSFEVVKTYEEMHY